MKSWNTPAINIVHLACFAANVWAGVFTHYKFHSNFWPFNFGAAGFIGAINIYGGITRRRHDEIRRHLNELILEQNRHRFEIAVQLQHPERTEKEIMEIREMAMKNLIQVATATGAKLEEGGGAANITIGQYRYRITPSHIERWRPGALLLTSDTTCLQVRGCIPYTEMIAATLLLLKNDPTIFDRWSRHDAYYS